MRFAHCRLVGCGWGMRYVWWSWASDRYVPAYTQVPVVLLTEAVLSRTQAENQSETVEIHDTIEDTPQIREHLPL